MIGLDTNVLVRYLVEDDPGQSKRAVALIEGSCTEDEPGFVNRIVLCELVWVLESSYAIPRATISNTLDRILRTAQFEIDAGDEMWAALRAYRTGGVDFADALIGRLNSAAGCDRTATFDRKAAASDDFFTP